MVDSDVFCLIILFGPFALDPFILPTFINALLTTVKRQKPHKLGSQKDKNPIKLINGKTNAVTIPTWKMVLIVIGIHLVKHWQFGQFFCYGVVQEYDIAVHGEEYVSQTSQTATTVFLSHSLSVSLSPCDFSPQFKGIKHTLSLNHNTHTHVWTFGLTHPFVYWKHN